MCNGIEVHINGRDICIPIYWIVWEFPTPHPDPPDPYRHAFDDIRVLATLDQGIARINNERVRVQLRNALKESFRAIELPKGFTVGEGLLNGPTKG